jgi:hypothetical protein
VPFEPLPMTPETLVSLMSEGTERAGLDYKRRLNLNETKDIVSIVKDFGAMQVAGGYIVIGADDNGRPSDLVTAAEAGLFDQAIVHSKVQGYLAEGFDIRSTALELDGAWYGLICVVSHPNGFAPFRVDGVHTRPDGIQKVDFRKGEVFARHGTKSERWDDSDVRKAIETIRGQERERARAEFRRDLLEITREAADTRAASASITALTFSLDTETLVNTALEQFRRDDQIPLRLLLTRAPQQASNRIGDGDGEALDDILDRLVSLAGAFLTIDRPERTEQVVQALAAIYNQGFDEQGMGRWMLPISPADFGLRIVTRVQALGALVVRRAQWQTIPKLVLQRPKVHDADYWQNWIRHGLVMASRAGLLKDPQNEQAGLSPLLLAQEHIVRLPWLRQDLARDDEDIISSLCQFDLLYCLTAYASDPKHRLSEFLPSFARWYSHRTDPAVVDVIEDPAVREAVFPMGQQELADALRALGEHARIISFPFGGWSGYEDPRILRFLQAQPPSQ